MKEIELNETEEYLEQIDGGNEDYTDEESYEEDSEGGEDTASDATEAKRDSTGRWQKGHKVPGCGRKKGVHAPKATEAQKLNKQIQKDLIKILAQQLPYLGDVLDTIRKDNPKDYASLLSSLMKYGAPVMAATQGGATEKQKTIEDKLIDLMNK